MPGLKTFLRDRFAGAKRVAVLGIGSDLRADDAAGILVAAELDKRPKKRAGRAKLKIFFGETAPENLTGVIKEFGPTHLVIIDAIEMKQKPGTIIVLTPDKIGAGVSFSTHKMPAEVLASYLSSSINCDIVIIGIQPKSIMFGIMPSKSVKDSAKEVAAAIIHAIPAR
ncbi:MAG: hydrogenase maturation peptidase HycI [Candidatus Omnitrophota bacterium]|nr:hydrogenase maturation peptidase HycI [Candidatus Omnitrophota bacterium]